MKSLKNLTGEEECSRLVFSSLRPVLEELGTTKILLQSQLYLLNQRVDLTQDRRHCAPSLDLADPFHPILHHFHIYITFFDIYLSVPRSIYLSSSVDGFERLCKKLKAALKKIISPQPLIKTRSCKLKTKLRDVRQ